MSVLTYLDATDQLDRLAAIPDQLKVAQARFESRMSELESQEKKGERPQV
jgi:hypothetical protein